MTPSPPEEDTLPRVQDAIDAESHANLGTRAVTAESGSRGVPPPPEIPARTPSTATSISSIHGANNGNANVTPSMVTSFSACQAQLGNPTGNNSNHVGFSESENLASVCGAVGNLRMEPEVNTSEKRKHNHDPVPTCPSPSIWFYPHVEAFPIGSNPTRDNSVLTTPMASGSNSNLTRPPLNPRSLPLQHLPELSMLSAFLSSSISLQQPTGSLLPPVHQIRQPLPLPTTTHPTPSYFGVPSVSLSRGVPHRQPQPQQLGNVVSNGRNVEWTSLLNPYNSGTSGFPSAKGPRAPKFSKPPIKGHRKFPSQSVNPIPNPAILPPPPLKATPPCPPNWEEHYENTILSLSTYKTFPIDASSQEFKTITELLNPIQVTSAEQIVNPDLWQRFTNTRREMLRVKTDDLSILSQLGFDDKEIQQRAHLSLNFVKDPLLSTESGKYSPNEAVLFHCTRNRHNLDKILNQGLDERLSSTAGGRLGKGIYFADNPQKSIKYDGNGAILVFVVLLGDCLSVDHLHNKHSLVREPEKLLMQRRTVNDQFFDSITARPTEGHRDNEYVIYNRYQCCPLYLIRYQKPRGSSHSFGLSDNNAVARQSKPTVAWRVASGTNTPMPNQACDGGWPFFAATMFEKMSVLPSSGLGTNGHTVPEELTPTPENIAVLSSSSAANFCFDVDDTNGKLAALVSFGFFDEDKNKEALQKFQNDLNHAVNYLLDNNNELQPTPFDNFAAFGDIGINDGTAAAAATSVENGPNYNLEPNQIETQMTPGSSVPVTEECSICCNEYNAFSHSPGLWKELKCKHKLCLSCYQSIETTGKTMQGVAHTSIRCPFCQEITGIALGSCPDGRMFSEVIPRDCEGYPGRSSIKIKYRIESGKHRLRRDAYLPRTSKGHEVLKLLNTAWDRRLIFVIGNSNTTGARNVLVWNIHHKTSLNGGVNSHGYPDPGYLDRVIGELKAYGIE